MRIAETTRPVTRPTTVDPSRAWILGLVVDADGSISDAPPAAPEWPSTSADAARSTDARPDQTSTQDVSSVRP
ncbi:MAG: hypothetical protein U0869_05905 [Chloroflexota bacterium]